MGCCTRGRRADCAKGRVSKQSGPGEVCGAAVDVVEVLRLVCRVDEFLGGAVLFTCKWLVCVDDTRARFNAGTEAVVAVRRGRSCTRVPGVSLRKQGQSDYCLRAGASGCEMSRAGSQDCGSRLRRCRPGLREASPAESRVLCWVVSVWERRIGGALVWRWRIRRGEEEERTSFWFLLAQMRW